MAEQSLELPAGGLSDGSVVVEPYGPEDAAPLLAGAQDEAVVRFANVPWAGLSVDELVELMEGTWHERAAAGEGLNAAIRDTEGDGLLGHFVVFGVDWRNDRCEVGFWLRREARGRGVTARALAVVCPWLYELGFVRVQASTDVENVPSQRSLERAGFLREGIVRAAYPLPGGGRCDHVLYSRLATD